MYSIVELHKWPRDEEFEISEVYWPFTSCERAEKYKREKENEVDKKEGKYTFEIKELKNKEKIIPKNKREKFFNYILRNLEKIPENHWIILSKDCKWGLVFKTVKKDKFKWIHNWWLYAFYYHKWINNLDEHITIYDNSWSYDYFKKADNKKDWDTIKWKKVLENNISKISIFLEI